MRPLERIRYNQKQIGRLREDVEAWKREHDTLADDCWAIEDMIDDMNLIFDRFQRIDIDVQRHFLSGSDFDAKWDESIRASLSDWLEVASALMADVGGLERQYGKIAGTDALNENIRAVRGILTPDDGFFSSEALVELRDHAVDSHRAGATELLLTHEQE